VVSSGSRVSIEHFDSLGLRVGSYWDGRRYGTLSVSSARKFN